MMDGFMQVLFSLSIIINDIINNFLNNYVLFHPFTH